MPWSMDVKTLSPVDQAYNYVLERVLSGELAPGMRVPADGIAEVLGISRMPVRDALRRLEGDGVVTIFANRGATVSEYSGDEIGQLIEMRAALEGLGARLALPQIGKPEVEELLHLQSRMNNAAADLGRWMMHHDNFHNFLTSLSGRPLLMRQTERMRMMLRPYFRRHHLQTGELEIPGHDHQKIVDAVLSRSADVIEQTVRDHAMATAQRLAKMNSSPARAAS
jgi:DNA-binding GntR family transcriptional regulator